MKVYFKRGIGGYSGKVDEAVFYYHPRLKLTLMRRFPKMPHQEMNDKYGAIAKKRKKIKPSANYKENFKTYTALLRDADSSVLVASWYNLYVKMMWALQRKYPETVNLETLTREQIYEQNLPCKTVKMAVEDRLLPVVTGYETLMAEI